jgi:hypothetical protein
MAELIASRAAERVASKAIEVHGGYGFTREYPIEKYLRDQKVGPIYEGTTNMQLLVIAKADPREDVTAARRARHPEAHRRSRGQMSGWSAVNSNVRSFFQPGRTSTSCS